MHQPKQSTTEPTTEFSSASLFVRIAAMLYDGLLILAMWMTITIVGIAINNGIAVEAGNPILSSILFIAVFVFYAKFWTHGGQTLGMRAWRLKIINLQSGQITLIQCMLRLVMAFISLAVCGLGYVWMLVDKDKLAWHDRFSYTRIVRLPKEVKK